MEVEIRFQILVEVFWFLFRVSILLKDMILFFFFFHLWVDSRAAWVLYPWVGNLCRRRKLCIRFSFFTLKNWLCVHILLLVEELVKKINQEKTNKQTKKKKQEAFDSLHFAKKIGKSWIKKRKEGGGLAMKITLLYRYDDLHDYMKNRKIN